MAGTSDIAIIGLVALMLSDKLGGLNLGGLLGKTDSDPKVEIATTESITCRCSDGFKMESDSGNCIQECESLGHGTKEERSETTTTTETETEKETRIIREHISMRTVCNTTGEIIDLTNVPNNEWAQVISDRCGYDCPEPYVFKRNPARCELPTVPDIYIKTTPVNPAGDYEEISGGRTWRDSPELQAVQAPAFLQNQEVTAPHEPPTIKIFQGNDY